MAADIRIDHVVALASSPEKAALGLAPLGLAAKAGGRHATWGTANVLVPLRAAYLEFLGAEDSAVAQRSEFGRSVLEGLSRGDGLWRVALGTGDMSATLAALTAQGIAVQGPVPGERLRPDGTRLRWQLAFPEAPREGGTPPMLIAWGDRAQAPYAPADLASPTIAWIGVATCDPRRLAQWYATAFGLPAQEMSTEAFGPAWRVTCRGGDLLLVGGAGAGREVRAILAEEGPGPFAVALRREGATRREVAVGHGRYSLSDI